MPGTGTGPRPGGWETLPYDMEPYQVLQRNLGHILCFCLNIFLKILISRLQFNGTRAETSFGVALESKSPCLSAWVTSRLLATTICSLASSACTFAAKPESAFEWAFRTTHSILILPLQFLFNASLRSSTYVVIVAHSVSWPARRHLTH